MEEEQNKLKELFGRIDQLSSDMLGDGWRQVSDGNKAAGRRSRKSSLELGRLLAEWRKASLEAAK